MRIGSLCTGYGGLDLAVGEFFEGHVAWTSEIDPRASLVTEARHPGAPNLGDLTATDWANVAPVDIITAGYPCQPFSQAGLQRGTDDPRHIWPHIARAVGILRPDHVVLENVAGHRSQGFGEVLGSLAELGYVGRWGSVRASDAGACHRRERVFIWASAPDADSTGPQGPQPAERHDVSPWGDRAADATARPVPAGGRGVHPARAGADLKLLPTPVAHPSQNTPENHLWKKNRRDGANRTQVTDIEVLVRQQWGDFSPLGASVQALPTPTLTDAKGGRNKTLGHADRTDAHHGTTLTDLTFGGEITAVDWGEYEPAIRHQEAAFGRPAPSPVNERGRLSPLFVEWMMGLPSGWVTDIVDHRGKPLAKTPALRILGNGVVPQQALLALHLLSTMEVNR